MQHSLRSTRPLTVKKNGVKTRICKCVNYHFGMFCQKAGTVSSKYKHLHPPRVYQSRCSSNRHHPTPTERNNGFSARQSRVSPSNGQSGSEPTNNRSSLRRLTQGKRKDPSDLRRHEKPHIIPFQAERRARDAGEAPVERDEKRRWVTRSRLASHFECASTCISAIKRRRTLGGCVRALSSPAPVLLTLPAPRRALSSSSPLGTDRTGCSSRTLHGLTAASPF